MQINYSAETKQNQRKRHAVLHQKENILRQKAKTSRLNDKNYCFILESTADHQGSQLPFRDFRLIGLFLVEKVLPYKNYIVRKLNTDKIKILHRIRLQKYNPEKASEDNYRETQWQIDEIFIIPQDDFLPLHWKQSLEDSRLIFVSFTLTSMQVIFMKGTHRDQILLFLILRSFFYDSSDG